LLLLAAGCSAERQEAQPADPARPAYIERGIASWYGKAFAGRRTASGERFDPAAFTAAHPTLPFG
jgi:rare lipoprotein A